MVWNGLNILSIEERLRMQGYIYSYKIKSFNAEPPSYKIVYKPQ